MTDNRPYSRDVQRYLDGEPHAALADAEREEADRLLQVVRTYAEGLTAPSAALDDAVLRQIRTAEPRRRGAVRWLFEPRPVRLRPVWVPLMAAAAAVVIWLGVRPQATPELSPRTVSAASDTVFVRFQMMAPEARQVAVVGSFDGWDPTAIPLVREDGGLWSVTLSLPLGEHQYQFVIDGERWVPDPRAHAQIDDGFGGTNSVVVVGPRGVVQS